MPYEYDVFISYKRSRFQTSWIVDYFLPRLEEHLSNYTAAQCAQPNVRLFFDQTEVNSAARTGLPSASGIEPGTLWREALIEGIGKSRCMVALYSPNYFHSKWCLSELKAFEDRAAQTGRNIIIPVSIHSMDRLPARAHSRNMFRMDDFVIDGPSFYESRSFPDFIRNIKLIAEKVAEAVCNAPAFVPWPTPPLLDENDPTPTPTPPVARF
ncbi:toll/interleukin-1 receptor domain-containing protein [Rhizobium ruizarguesonis]|uniref:toll/interleukin-1 receptor domain-containing protein n=1 Tax=Rhizobium ruizarguesonis TaxID=2081791 RepID=UPI00102FFF66|nr:toll/interleukin-1 receptor domain-containing protein [Rhizobium ruizarguesonis]NKL10886.1 TIR domain-containing protein [Rhizobium leguminosarum bv. viciae]NEJ03094.1 TIR domain-containing protein [Rhizobium ruizarguesonis]NEJ40210.1 TIR domain-containing protein [Rhizobium ruizarguesonis]TAT91687.1 toll/interleukin-1 receptor domain-containing protein [Rhizobium ruizarguesonis]TAZ03628.1 toll/interleukin-1 receptor domain-containing protein [Rhizobium ruizarguesonis]